jgi:hypothetical protein
VASEYQEKLGATKGQATLLVLFIPSVDRYSVAIGQEAWVARALETLGNCFGGATAFPKAKGVWRDDASGGNLVFDEPVIINCYTSELALEEHVETLREFLIDMGSKTNQGAVGLVIDRDYLEIDFPLEGGPNG